MNQIRRYKVLTNDFKIKTITGRAEEMQQYVEMGLAALALPERSFPWNTLYSGQDPLYGNWLSDPEEFMANFYAYPSLRKGFNLLRAGKIRSIF